MKNKTIVMMIMFLVILVSAVAITKTQFINLDLNSTNRNINKIGLVRTIDSETNTSTFNYLVEWDAIKEYNGTYPVSKSGCDYNINTKTYKLCKYKYNTTYCKQELIDKIRGYCIHRLQVELKRELALQELAIASMTDDEIELDLQGLNITII